MGLFKDQQDLEACLEGEKEPSRQQDQLEQRPRCRKTQDMITNVSHVDFLKLGACVGKKEVTVAENEVGKNPNVRETLEDLGGP